MPNSCTSITQRDFEDLYSKYRSQFIAISRMYIRDETAAEDIVTDSFMAFWEKHNTIKVDNIPAYILTSVKNRSLKWLRDKKAHDEVHQSIHSVACRLLEQNIGRLESTLPKTILFWEVGDIIEATLRKMPERTRKVFFAHRIEEMSYQEIEQLYKLTGRQINHHIQSAKGILRVALKDYLTLAGVLMLLT